MLSVEPNDSAGGLRFFKNLFNPPACSIALERWRWRLSCENEHARRLALHQVRHLVQVEVAVALDERLGVFGVLPIANDLDLLRNVIKGRGVSGLKNDEPPVTVVRVDER